MGLPGSGKTTLSWGVHNEIHRPGHPAVVMDADLLRQGPMRDLGFSAEDRVENAWRLASFADALETRGLTVIVAAVTPSLMAQVAARAVGSLLVYLTGRHRDLWPGHDFEAPSKPDLVIDTLTTTLTESIQLVVAAYNGGRS